jgi:branched-chain amino acid transport system ATP-binding protein
MSGALLRIADLTVRFGGVVALADVAVSVAHRSVHGLIGPNGAGKTTLLNCISRLVRPNAGSMEFNGVDLLRMPAHRIAGLGITRTFQNFGLVGELTVLENVMAGLHAHHGASLMDELMLIRRRNRFEAKAREASLRALELTGLSQVALHKAADLSYGMRKSVELARAVVSGPQLLLLDEPTAGLNEPEMDRLRDILQALRRQSNLSILVISHHLEFLLNVVDSVTVLDLGRRIAHGEPALVKTDPKVVAAYVGEEP